MKPVTTEFQTALGENLTFLCRLWEITRRDGQVFRFTDHDRDITYSGQLYKSSTAFTASAVETNVNSASNNLDVTVLLAAGSIEYLDLERGMFDDAVTRLYVVNYRDLTAGALELFEGRVNNTTLPNQHLGILALIGGVRRTNRTMIERYSLQCRASFGDARCKYDLDLVTEPFAVGTVPTGLHFLTADLAMVTTGLYTLGVIEWTGGDNLGTRVEVAGNDAGNVYLLFKPPFAVQPGDTGNITRGCPRTVAACMAYDNLPNYRGEPYVPGDKGIKA